MSKAKILLTFFFLFFLSPTVAWQNRRQHNRIQVSKEPSKAQGPTSHQTYLFKTAPDVFPSHPVNVGPWLRRRCAPKAIKTRQAGSKSHRVATNFHPAQSNPFLAHDATVSITRHHPSTARANARSGALAGWLGADSAMTQARRGSSVREPGKHDVQEGEGERNERLADFSRHALAVTFRMRAVHDPFTALRPPPRRHQGPLVHTTTTSDVQRLVPHQSPAPLDPSPLPVLSQHRSPPGAQNPPSPPRCHQKGSPRSRGRPTRSSLTSRSD